MYWGVLKTIPEFQFLIGRLQTVREILLSTTSNKFQFLIGRLQTTEGIAMALEFDGGFNSL